VARVVQFSAPRVAEVVDFDPPPLPPGHVRVRTAFSGISAGTELTAYRGTNPYLTRSWDPDARLFRESTAGIAFPVVGWGYSESGEVTEVADDVTGLAVGDQVWGIWGHRSEAVLPAEKLAGHQLPDGVDLAAAAFARVGAIAFNAILAAGISLGELVAIYGQGVIGLLATRLAVLSGARVVTVDAVPARREESVRFGAVESLAPGAAAERIRELSPAGADTAIELSGVYAALHEAIRSVTVGGRVVASGFYQGGGDALRLGEEFHHNRVQLVSSQIGGVPPELTGRWSVDRLQTTFLGLIGSGQVDVRPLISHRVPVDDAADAYTLLDTRPGDALQVLLEF
jgi:2-desacetyl-2-hydroxyethyl bacteriochlorophyllide A dehydrogenase